MPRSPPTGSKPKPRDRGQPSIAQFLSSTPKGTNSLKRENPKSATQESDDSGSATATASAVPESPLVVLPPLEIVWAKFPSYPPWPAIVCPEPGSSEHLDKGSGEVHVQFFDMPPSHAWVEMADVQKMTKESAIVKAKRGGRWAKELEAAVREAQAALDMSPARRKAILVDFGRVDEGVGTDRDEDDDDETQDFDPKLTGKKRKKTGTSNAKKRKRDTKDPSSETSDKLDDKENVDSGLGNDEEPVDDDFEMSEYDKIRERNIAERRRLFHDLQLSQAKEQVSISLAKTRVASKRGLAAEPKVPLPPSRRSLRLQNVEADNSQKLPEKEPTLAWRPADEHPTLPLRTLVLAEITKEDGEDFVNGEADFLRSLPLESPDKKAERSFGDDAKKALTKLVITENRVAKVVPDRIFSMAVHPTESKILLAVGAKWGGVGLWDVLDTASDHHGVHLFMPHSRPVNCLSFNAYNPEQLVSASYDGSLRLFDLAAQKMDLLYGSEDEDYAANYFKQLDDNNFLVALGRSGMVGLVDKRADSKNHFASRFQVYTKKTIKMVDVHPIYKDLMLCSTGQGACGIFDIRKGGDGKQMRPVLEFMGHTKSLSSGQFSPVTGKSIVTVAYDNKLRLYKSWSKSATEILPYKSIDHDNMTGRWLTTFKAEWHPRRDDLFFVGSMARPRQIEAFSDQGVLQGTLSGENLGSICSIVKCHPTMEVVAGGNSSGRVYVFM